MESMSQTYHMRDVQFTMTDSANMGIYGDLSVPSAVRPNNSL